MSSVIDNLTSVGSKISNIPNQIINGITSLFDSVISWLRDIYNGIIDIPSSIGTFIEDLGDFLINGVKAIFIPDMEEMKREFRDFSNRLNPSDILVGGTVDVIFSEAESVTSKEPINVYSDLDFSLLSLRDVKLVDYSSLKTAVEYFRPIINGFIFFLMGLYWYKEFLSFIGQAPNMGSAANTANEHLAKKED